MAVWLLLSIVTVALVGVVSWDEYQQAQRAAERAAPPSATASSPTTKPPG